MWERNWDLPRTWEWQELLCAPKPFMLQALVSGFGTGAKEAAFWNRRDWRRGKGMLLGCFLHFSFFYGKGGFVLAERLQLNRSLQAGSRRVLHLIRCCDDTFGGKYFMGLLKFKKQKRTILIYITFGMVNSFFFQVFTHNTFSLINLWDI